MKSAHLPPLFPHFSATLLLLAFTQGHAQHDAQRNAVRHIAAGELDKVAGEFENLKVDVTKVETLVEDPETLFVGVLAALAEGDVDQALINAQAAVNEGLPFDRLRAGPRELLGKLFADPEYREWEGSEERRAVIHGPMVGSVTDTSAAVWLRTAGAVEDISAIVFGQDENSDRHESYAPAVDSDESTDFAVVFNFEDLIPDTDYVGNIEVGDGIDNAEVYLFSFRTRPPEGEAANFKVAFGGGAGYVPEWERMWLTIGDFHPDALLMLGDNVYIDDPEHSLTQHYCYSRRQSRPEWRRLVAGTPVHAIYDDHDFGLNDCVPGPEIESPPWKREVWSLFRRNWVNPAYGGGEEQPGCWHDFAIGDVRFFLLDTRYYRDLEGGSMLGPVQRKWLKERLRSTEATFKVIVSSVPFTPGVKPGSKDTWDGFPGEREEIFSLIAEEKMDGVFLVSADRHRTDLRTTARPGGYDLYEFMSSKLTNRHTHKVVPTDGLVWGYNERPSFGLMDFDTEADDPVVVFRCIDIDGKEVESFELRRSMISH